MDTVEVIVSNDTEVEVRITEVVNVVEVNVAEGTGGGGPAPVLDDLRLEVDGAGTYDPPAGVAEINLPSAWLGRRIRVQIGGPVLFNRVAITRTTAGFTIAGGIEGGQFLIIENY
jgi:hypothetical protein